MGKRLPAAAENDIVAFVPNKSEVGALALITYDPEKYAAEVYQPFADRLTTAIDSVKAIDYDIKTTAGMAVAIKARATFRDLRVEAEKVREARKAPIIKIGKLLQSGYANLEARITPLEELFDFDIQRESDRKAKVKAEAERLESVRVAAIRAKIDAIRIQPAQAVGSTASELHALLEQCAAREITKEEFAELADEAALALDATGQELLAMLDKAKASEAAALAAEEARKSEAARIEAERAELAQLRAAAAETARLTAIENERIANEQVAERQRLADLAAAQEAEQRRIAEKAAAALAEQTRVAAGTKRQLDAQQAAIAADRAAFVREQAEVAARAEAAAKLETDHAEALTDNATFDDAIARLAAVDTPTFHVEPSEDLARCNGMVADLRADRSPIAESVDAYEAAGLSGGLDETPTDKEIIENYIESFGGTPERAFLRIAKMVMDVLDPTGEMMRVKVAA